jgi:hypothetical protein
VNEQKERRKDVQLDRKEHVTCDVLEPGKGYGSPTSQIIKWLVAAVRRTREHHARH